MDFAIPMNHKVEIKKRNLNKIESCQRAENLRKMRVTVIPIVIGVFGSVPKSMEKGLKEKEISGKIMII